MLSEWFQCLGLGRVYDHKEISCSDSLGTELQDRLQFLQQAVYII